MEWVIAANSTESVVKEVNALLHQLKLDTKYQICNVERLHPKVTDYRVTFSKQV